MPQNGVVDASPFLSLVIPAYNEEGRLVPTLETVLAYLKTRPYRSELIVVDDGSSDGTVRVARAAMDAAELDDRVQASVLSYKPNGGKGRAVRTGVLAASGRFVAFIDADLSTPVDQVDRALDLLDQPSGYDAVIGSRTAPGAEIRRAQPLYRRLSSKLFNMLRDKVVGIRLLPDTQCGLKVFEGDVARSIFARQQIDGFMFDVETVYIARRLGLSICEMGVPWTDAADSKVRLSSGFRLLPDLWRIRQLHGRLSPRDRR